MEYFKYECDLSFNVCARKSPLAVFMRRCVFVSEAHMNFYVSNSKKYRPHVQYFDNESDAKDWVAKMEKESKSMKFGELYRKYGNA